MKRKRVILTIVIALLLLGASFAFLFFVPVVVFVKPNVPSLVGEKFTYPSFFQKGYVTVSLSEKNLTFLSSFKEPKLVVYSPLTRVPEGLYHTLQWGTKDSAADICVTLDETKMWQGALDHLEKKPVAFLYERFDNRSQRILDDLTDENPNLVPVAFDGRISGVNLDDIVSQLDTFYAVLAPSVVETEDALRKTKGRVVMDEREAVSLTLLDRIISITIDWKKVLPEAFLVETGELEADYTIAVVH